jgi:preprotein translocase subunit SecF
MIEIFKNTNYDFLGKKNIFIAFSVITSLIGMVFFFTKGFNLGIDFAGGTVVTVRFKKTYDESRLLSALSKQGVDTTKIIVQQIVQIGEQQKNDVLIRLPQIVTTESAGAGIDANKRAIIDALANNYSEIPATARQNKIDLNSANLDTLRTTLVAKGPLGGTPEAEQEYIRLAKNIIQYRDNQRSGLIGDISEIPLGGFSPQLGDTLKNNFYAADFNIVDASVVGPQVGKELTLRAIYVTVAALIGMLIYIAFRFEFIYGVGAVVATVHDVIITLACFSIFGWEISLNVIAALLTLIGYSMNDTIVIFDRIREDMKVKRREEPTVLSNNAINSTLSRTIITSGLTFMSVVALLVFGGPVLRGFSWTLFIGILIGTYSSIAIATPIMLMGKSWSEKQAATKKASVSDKQKTAKA